MGKQNPLYNSLFERTNQLPWQFITSYLLTEQCMGIVQLLLF